MGLIVTDALWLLVAVLVLRRLLSRLVEGLGVLFDTVATVGHHLGRSVVGAAEARRSWRAGSSSACKAIRCVGSVDRLSGSANVSCNGWTWRSLISIVAWRLYICGALYYI